MASGAEWTAETEARFERLFGRLPACLQLARSIAGLILAAFPAAGLDVQQSQATFRAVRGFAAIWPPVRPMRGRPDLYVVLSFWLDRLVRSPRIVEAVEASPGRWTHHMLITHETDLDHEALAWLSEAHKFACRKPLEAKKRRSIDA